MTKIIVLTCRSPSLGWWLGKNDRGQAWVPSAYVEEQVAPPPAPAPAPRAPPPPPGGANGTRSKPTPPAPPAKRPAAGRKPAGLQARDSGMSLNGGADNSSTRSLADALLARKNAMQKDKDDDDDW